MLDKSLDHFTSFASEITDVARQIVRTAAAGQRRPAAKSDSSPVTETDRAVEQMLRGRIADRFPGHGVLGEEFGAEGLDKEFVWVIDPIDGTKAFIGGLAVYGTLISLTHGGTPVLGIIDNPVTGDRWLGQVGRNTTLNGKAVRTASTAVLAEAFMANGNPEPFQPDEKGSVDRLRQSTRWCVYGGSCMAYGRVADGSIDISIDGGLDPYDYCALVPIVKGAGGCITDWQGRPLTLASGNLCLASANEAIHRQALKTLN
ncbi:histidinol-phosphatase [Agrobacterium sp. InxBP2]|uniref:histidinol-phosphatase n=1 Tax=Agrobacterium sp. InxBP2 TaxID=2870329 RepID=UPI00249F4823|nr:histidinol-phosphatase [Agrobacterium sp. InxBP2]MCW8281608.1 histidinol-phosphatase [Agrobacterium sp. InxBP2]